MDELAVVKKELFPAHCRTQRGPTRSIAAPRMKTRFWSEIVDGEVKRK